MISQTADPSADKKTITKTLKAQLVAVKAILKKATALALIHSFLFIVQSACLAGLFARFLDAAHERNTMPAGQYLPLAGGFFLCYLLRALFDYGKARLLQEASITARRKLRATLLATLARLGPQRRHYGSDGSLSAQLLEQVDALDGYIRHFYLQQRVAALMPLLIAAAAALYSPLAAALMLLTAPLVPVFMILAGIAAAEKNRRQLAALALLGGRFLDMIRGLPTLRRLGAQQQAQRFIECSAEEYRKRTMGVLALAFLSTAVLELFATLAIALVAVYLGLGLIGVLPWAQGRVPVAYEGALFILLLAPEFYAPLRKLGADYHDKAKAEAAIAAFLPLLGVSAPARSGKPLTLRKPPALTLEALTITTREQRVRLPPCHLTVAAGERIGIRGASGSGKSSLLQALLGFADYRGVLRIDGEEVATLDRDFLRGQIAYLSQDPPMLPGSIAENLRLANGKADDSHLHKVLKQVQLWPLIQRLPQGIDTVLGERGRGLSGGQLQRLSLAQLLLRDAPLWLLDEPTAHLDPQTAAELLPLLGTLSAGKTVLLASHNRDIAWLDRFWEIPAGEARVCR